ncbi:MAG: GDP-mannose 4,6-dehydratase [Patescibacteria group bacterium]
MPSKVYLENKNILVLGGAGFIGSHLCEELVKRGDNVICVDNFVSSDVENIRTLLEYPNFEFVRHNITRHIEYESLPELKRFKVDVAGWQEIYNLACPTAPKDFAKFPVQTATANSVGVIKSLELAKKYKARYLLVSSSAVYGNPSKDGQPVPEDYVGNMNWLGPRACYNEGKRFAEMATLVYRDICKLDAKVARVFSTYGTRMLRHSGRQVVDFIHAAVDNTEITIFGDKKMTMTFCYVKDIVDGLIALMASDVKEPINLGSEKPYTLTAVAETVIRLTNSSSKIAYGDQFAYSNQPTIPDISRAKNELNWFPLVSLEDGLKQAVEYYKATAFLRQPIEGQSYSDVDED